MTKSDTMFHNEIDIPDTKTKPRINLIKPESQTSRRQREARNGHKSCILWLTGLSGSGKSTLAIELEKELFKRHCQVRVLDGDSVRQGLNNDLGFSPDDREENIRRIGEVSKMFMESGFIAISAFISPYKNDRDRIRKILDKTDFIEIHLDCPLEICEQRDVKGLYKKARAGLIKDFTGIDAPYEKPENPELSIHTDWLTVAESVKIIINYLEKENYLCRK